MVSALSSATNGMHVAISRFDKAAESVASSGLSDQPDSPAAPSTDSLDSATVTMITARLAFRASLVAARTANEMAGDLMNLEYVPKAKA